MTKNVVVSFGKIMIPTLVASRLFYNTHRCFFETFVSVTCRNFKMLRFKDQRFMIKWTPRPLPCQGKLMAIIPCPNIWFTAGTRCSVRAERNLKMKTSLDSRQLHIPIKI
ncbi:hypothetical protein NPIL_63771 [Nephila pilipes]|uniref:Uncharacterized protein n=1 Tax=Nephila pilipes TaxID=299642 RepID=A0A8X6IRJ0_NEPPI|nr:hypothetical protein NPIL_63771 [Nephila pilipes]